MSHPNILTPTITSSSGCLGTEETLLTMCYYRRPDLFHVHHNLERLDGHFDEGGDVCHMLWPGWPAQVRKTRTHNPPLFFSLHSSASDAPAPPHIVHHCRR